MTSAEETAREEMASEAETVSEEEMTLAEETAREEMASEVETASETEMTSAEETAREETVSEAETTREETTSEVAALVATAREIPSREETADLTLAVPEVTEAEMTFSDRSYFL